MQILFHRGRMLLLDQVTITDGKAIGEFTVTAENCVGHEPIPGKPVLRGVELPEMAFQLLGVMIAKNPELASLVPGNAFVAREIAGVRIRNGFITPGDKLILETGTTIDVEQVGGVVKIASGIMTAKIGKERKGMVTSVTLAGFNPTPIEQQKLEAS